MWHVTRRQALSTLPGRLFEVQNLRLHLRPNWMRIYGEGIQDCVFLNTHFIFFHKFFFSVALGLYCWAWSFSSCCEWGLLFVAVHGFLTAVASLVVEHRLLGAQASAVAATGLVTGAQRLLAVAQEVQSTGSVALQHVGSSWTRDWTHVPCIGRQILIHCTPREVPRLCLNKLSRWCLSMGKFETY